MSFDMPPDDDPHDECRHEIHRLTDELAALRQRCDELQAEVNGKASCLDLCEQHAETLRQRADEVETPESLAGRLNRKASDSPWPAFSAGDKVKCNVTTDQPGLTNGTVYTVGGTYTDSQGGEWVRVVSYINPSMLHPASWFELVVEPKPEPEPAKYIELDVSPRMPNAPHYRAAGCECRDVAKDILSRDTQHMTHWQACCWFSIFQYVWRAPLKGTFASDLKKARDYIDWCLKSLEEQEAK